ncbi:MAG: heavy-metal-associated domain-containing protein, partial [Cetobacterium sp.]
MKKEYDIINLHCGGCASKIQYELDKLDEIKDVNVDFYTKKLKLTLVKENNEDVLLKKLNEIADKVEPGTYFKKNEKNHNHEHDNHGHSHEHSHEHTDQISSKIDLIILTMGVTLFVVGLTLEKSLQKDIILIIAYMLSGHDI